MQQYAVLAQNIRKLYEARNPERDVWADWLYENHIFVAADYAEHIAKKYNANPELAMAGAALHDIADTKMSRFEPKHAAETLVIAREQLQKAGYNSNETDLVVNAVQFHSCHDDEKPSSKEGLIVATADALTHLQTDFICMLYGQTLAVCRWRS